MLDKDKDSLIKSGEGNQRRREERGQSLLVPGAEVNQKEMSFGNQLALRGVLGDRSAEATGAEGEE